MTGKEKCNLLRQLRKDIAKANDITWIENECLSQEDCLGSCPKCDEALQILEQEIMAKKGEIAFVDSLKEYYSNVNQLDSIDDEQIYGDVTCVDF